MIRVFQLWDLIETWSFREDIMDIDNDDDTNNNDKKDDNNKDNKVNKGISALGVDT